MIDSFARGLLNYISNVCVCFFFSFLFFCCGGGAGEGRGFPFSFWSFDDDGLLLPACMQSMNNQCIH